MLHRSWRIAALAAVLLLAGPVLAGCGSSPASAGTVLRIWYSTDDPVERGWSQQLATQFEVSHPHVTVQLTDYSFEDLNTKLQLALASGDPPDLAYVTPRGPGIPAYVAAHRLRDLTAPARAYGWASRLRPGLLTSYNRPFSFFGAKKGSVTAVPMSLAAVGVLYNRALLRRLHLTVPDSLAAFVHALARAHAAGYTAIGIGNADGWLGDDWYLTLVNALSGPAALQPEQRLDPHFSFLRPPCVQAARMLQDWATRGYLTPNFGGLDAQEGVDLFFRGRTLFQLISSSQNAQIRVDQQRTRLDVGVFAFPGTAVRRVVPMSGYLGWVVPSQSSHPAQAIQFINSLLMSATSAFLIRQGLLPVHRDAAGGYRAPARRGQGVVAWQRQYLNALDMATAGVYLDAAPVANINATMEANVQLLLQGYEDPRFLAASLEKVYSTHGKSGSTARIDGEF